jgi:5-methyltetrahydropteroyltriglutamate--homocysteine methyltransferase
LAHAPHRTDWQHPRPPELIEAVARSGGNTHDPALSPLFERAIKDTLARFEATGSPVITDGEQRKYHNFWDYCVHGMENTAPDGFRIPFAAGHVRRMPRLTRPPFRYREYGDQYLDFALEHSRLPVKQAVISPSALSLLYPTEPIEGYSREEFIEDLLAEHVGEVRRCLDKGAHAVQIDFTEGRLAVKIDPTGALLASFIDLNNIALARLTNEERLRVGVHTCPGGDRDSTHSADVAYGELLPSLLQLNLTNYYVSLAGEPDRRRVLATIRDYLQPHQRIFVGVVAPIDPRVETAEEVRDRVLEAAEFIPPAQLGTTDDCGFSPQRRHFDVEGYGVRQDHRARARHGAGLGGPGYRLMDDDTEERLLRSAALSNAQSILQARQRAERDLLRTKEELEEEKRVLELLNRTGAMLATKLEVDAIVQAVTDAATEIRERTPETGGRTPAIALTAFARSEDRTRAMLAGYQVHVSKPIEAHELIAAVKSLSSRPAP